MAEQMYKIRGTLSEGYPSPKGGVSPTYRLIPGAARDGAADDIAVFLGD